MRLIGSLSNPFLVRRFCLYLAHRGIAHSSDARQDVVLGTPQYQIWIHDEDQVALALSLWEQFQHNSLDPMFRVEGPLPAAERRVKEHPLRAYVRAVTTPVTWAILLLSVLFFMLDVQQSYLLQQEGRGTQLTQVESLLLFDVPEQGGGYTSVWRGFSSWILLKWMTGSGEWAEGPLFVKIRQGEVWRLFSPALLHRDFLHILFNMIWLWMLSRPMEERLGSRKMILFVLMVGVGSNVAQYLMSGPFFLGYSGVITGMAGFIWMRMRIAPWEGYPIPRNTLLFLGLFVIGMVLLQGVTFVIRLATSTQMSSHIANSAHIVGAVMGMWLGRTSWFTRRAH